MRTVPVNQSSGPLAEGCEPTRLMSMFLNLLLCLSSLRHFDGHLHQSRYVEFFSTTIDLSQSDNPRRWDRFAVLLVVNRQVVARRPIRDLAHVIRLRPSPFC